MALRTDIIDLVRGDYGSPYTLTLRNRKTKVTIDLTGVTLATMKLRAVGTTLVLATVTLNVLLPFADGKLQLMFPLGALDHPAGRYEGEVELTNVSMVKTPYETIQFRIREQF